MSRNVDRVVSTRKSFNYVTDNETLAALGFPQNPAENSETGPLSPSARPAAVPNAPQNAELPSRRSLRSAAPVTADAIVTSAPAQPGSRRGLA